MKNLVRRDFKSGVIEIVYSSEEFNDYKYQFDTTPVLADNTQIFTEEELLKKKDLSLASSVGRSRKTIKSLVYNNVNMSWRFLTLTYASKCLDRDKIWRNISQCFNRLSKYLKRKVHYIAVLELHKDGISYHAHCLCNISYFRNETFQKYFWKHGFVKLEKLKTNNSNNSITKTCGYLLKYISKDFNANPEHKKRYLCSQGLNRDTKKSYILTDIEGAENIISSLVAKGCFLVHHYSGLSASGVYIVYALFERKRSP